MAVEQNEGLSILFDTIKGKLRHQDYARVCEIAYDYTTYATGYNICKKLRKFNKRETEDDFKQREMLTQINTPDIFNSCVKPMYKVGRTPASITVRWDGKDAAKTSELKKELYDAGSQFWGKKNVEKYITQRQADLDSMDPNSFVVVEFKERVDPTKPGTKARPYPFEVNSAEAINYIYENNDLKWLAVLNHVTIQDGKGKEIVGEKYYMYVDNWSIAATQIHKDLVPQALTSGAISLDNFDYKTTELKININYIFNTTEKSEAKRQYFVVNVFNHKIGFVPAKRFGTVLDPVTRNRTCLPLIHAAQSYLEKSIKTMSEFDLTNCLHVFPQKIQYSDPCPGEETIHGFIGCDAGMRVGGKHKCGACGGTGFKVHTSAQDIIQIRMPKNLEDIVSLENIMVYKNPPIDLLEFQKKFGFYELRQAAQSAVYNSDVFTRQEIATTATEKSIDLDAVYDTLTPYSETWSEFYVFFYKCIASLRDLQEGFVISHEFPKDFKMQSFSALLDDLTKANTNGAPSYIKKSITKDITRKVYADQPQEILRIDTKEKYYPFPGKDPADINFIIANSLTTKFNKILWSNFDLIFSEIEFEQGKKQVDFYQMEEETQRALIKTKVDAMITALDAEDAANAAITFANAGLPGNSGNNNPAAGPGGNNAQ